MFRRFGCAGEHRRRDVQQTDTLDDDANFIAASRDLIVRNLVLDTQPLERSQAFDAQKCAGNVFVD